MKVSAVVFVAGCLLTSNVAAVELKKVADGFVQPLAVRAADDDSGRWFVAEQDGLVRTVIDGQILVEPLLDLSLETGSGLTNSSGERGLLGLALDPDFASNGFVFVNYTDSPSSGPGNFRTVVARYTIDTGNPNQLDPASALIILSVTQDFNNHNGGDIHFGPDGYLYVGMGDGGSGGDPRERSQDLGMLLGKMLRIDVDQNATPAINACGIVANYAIPASNPFAGARRGAGVACPEIWSSGVRNPYRFSFDRDNGDLLIGDVGQRRVEEISLAPAGVGGQNFGWDCREGSTEYGSGPNDPGAPSPLCTGISGLTDPILEYDHQAGRCSVTGGYRSRGPLAELAGQYVYGDYCTGEIFTGTEQAGGSWSAATLIDPASDPTDYCSGGLCLSGFAEDEQGNVLVIDRGGRIYQLSETAFFADGFE